MRPSAAAAAVSRGHQRDRAAPRCPAAASRTGHLSAASQVSLPPSVGPAACLLLKLSFDEVEVLGYQLSDPLRPQLAVYLSSAARGLREAMQRVVTDLRRQHEEAKAFAVSVGSNCEGFRAVAELHLGGGWHDPPFGVQEAALAAMTPGRWRMLGNLFKAQSLPHLDRLQIIGSDCGDAGVALLAAGLRSGCLPSLEVLQLQSAQIGPQGASALATALTKHAVPKLGWLTLSENPLGDVGLVALAASLRQLPALAWLHIDDTECGDAGLAALLVQPMAGALASLKSLSLKENRITDAGLGELAAVLGQSGALPKLWPAGSPSVLAASEDYLPVQGNPASHAALRAVRAVRDHGWFRFVPIRNGARVSTSK